MVSDIDMCFHAALPLPSFYERILLYDLTGHWQQVIEMQPRPTVNLFIPNYRGMNLDNKIVTSRRTYDLSDQYNVWMWPTLSCSHLSYWYTVSRSFQMWHYFIFRLTSMLLSISKYFLIFHIWRKHVIVIRWRYIRQWLPTVHSDWKEKSTVFAWPSKSVHARYIGTNYVYLPLIHRVCFNH